jgi:hypothetical protein
MSLVHEALQKAELEKQRKAGIAPESHRALPQPTQHFGSPGSQSIDAPAMISAGGAIAVREFAGNAAAIGSQKSSPLLTALIGTVTAVAMVAIVFLVALASSTLQDSKRAVTASPMVAPSPGPAPAAEAGAPKAQPVEASVAINKEEPAASAVQQPTAQSAEPRFKLSGITRDPDGKYWAIINGKLRDQDEYVDGATIKSVERDRVTLDLGNGQTTVLRLF